MDAAFLSRLLALACLVKVRWEIICLEGHEGKGYMNHEASLGCTRDTCHDAACDTLVDNSNGEGDLGRSGARKAL
jgi:hypothetical protein